MRSQIEKAVPAHSGEPDASIVVSWLKENSGREVVTRTAYPPIAKVLTEVIRQEGVDGVARGAITRSGRTAPQHKKKKEKDE